MLDPGTVARAPANRSISLSCSGGYAYGHEVLPDIHSSMYGKVIQQGNFVAVESFWH